MDVESKLNLSEGMPLNSTGAANIFFNTGRNTKVNPDGPVIHLKTEKPSDLGVHINTTVSIASSKKIKLLFLLNFLLSVICMAISSSFAFYCWNEMSSVRKQLDMIKDQFLFPNFKDGLVINQDKIRQSALISNRRPHKDTGREPRMEYGAKDEIPLNARRYYVEDLGDDMLLVDSSKKDSDGDKLLVHDKSFFQKDLLVVHFNGALRETNLGTNSIIGPWVRDTDISTKNSENKIELNTNFVTIKESGLYFIYAQVVYLTHAPNCYFIWARQPAQQPRLLTTCASGDDSSNRPLDKSQISCSAQTVARLYKGDTVNLAQREQNRTLWLRSGYTYLGFIKLSS